MQIEDHTRVIDLTVGELGQLILEILRRQEPRAVVPSRALSGVALSLAVVARRLGISKKTARKKCREGVWPHMNVGGPGRPVYKFTEEQVSEIESGGLGFRDSSG